MKDDAVLTLHSSIKPSLKKEKVLQGSLWGALGIAIWLFGALFLTLEIFTLWGLPILLIGGGFITYGLLPYRKLTRLESNPHQILVDESEQLIFFMDKQPLIKISLKDIEEIAYLDDDNRYGIGLWLKKTLSQNFEWMLSNPNFEQYRSQCQKNYFCDVFLPYFSKRSFEELELMTKQP